MTTPHLPRTSLLARATTVLFDFNGTLAQDEIVIADLLAEIASEHLDVLISHAVYFEHFAGLTEHEMFARLLRECQRDPKAIPSIDALITLFTERYVRRTADGSCISAPVRALVAELHERGVKLAVVTAATAAMAHPALHASGLKDRFTCVITLDDVTRPKPDPEAYLLALDRLDRESTLIADSNRNARLSGAIAVEDSRAGIAAARAAGLRVIGVEGSVPILELSQLVDEVFNPQALR